MAEIAKAQAFGLARRGHEVTVATERDPARATERWPAHVTVREFSVSGAGNARSGCQGETAAYKRFIASLETDIILCNCWQNWATDLAVEVFPKTRAKKVILSQGFNAHLWHRHRRFAWGLGQWLLARSYVRRLPAMLKAFDHLIFLSSQRDRQRFYDHWMAGRLALTRRSILPNGVWLRELAERQPAFRQRHGIQTPHLVLNVANYCDRKNQMAALRAFAKLGRRDATLVFIGSERNTYSEQMVHLGRELLRADFQKHVLILTQVPRATIYSAYQAADIFLLPSKDETQPVVLLEAMGSGVPWVSTPTGCVREMPGGLIAHGETEMADALATLLNDSGRRRQLGEQGRAAVQSRYSWESVLQRYEALFEELLGEGYH